MSGFYLMHRGWMDNPVFRDEPYTRAQAWCWLIEQANYAAGRMEVKGKTVAIGRGQLRHSLRHLAREWGWDDARVRRFLARLENEKMIRSVVDAGQTLITICNYEQYQASDRVGDAPTDAGATQERRSTDAIHKEEKQGKESCVVDARALVSVGERVLDLVGTRNDPRWLGCYAPAQGWLAAGCDPDLDIFPTIQRVMAQRGAQGPPSNMSYFTRAVMQAKADRLVIPSEATPNARQPPQRTEPRGASGFAVAIAELREGSGGQPEPPGARQPFDLDLSAEPVPRAAHGG